MTIICNRIAIFGDVRPVNVRIAGGFVEQTKEVIFDRILFGSKRMEEEKEAEENAEKKFSTLKAVLTSDIPEKTVEDLNRGNNISELDLNQ